MPYDTLVVGLIAQALAVGAALLMYVARKINIHMLENVLFGLILIVIDQDLLILAVSCLLIMLLIRTFNRILLTYISPDIAKVRGFATNYYDYLFVMMITLVTIASVKIVGAVLVGALLLIPGATARLLTKNMGSFVLLSAMFFLCATSFRIVRKG